MTKEIVKYVHPFEWVGRACEHAIFIIENKKVVVDPQKQKDKEKSINQLKLEI